MSDPAWKVPAVMNTADFLAWDAPGNGRWQLVDGEPQTMAPANRSHGTIHAELGRLIGNHLDGMSSSCTVVTAVGVVPRIRSDSNVRIPDIAVTHTETQLEESTIGEPVLLIDILSPGHRSETWTNVWAYTTIPSVQEILVIDSIRMHAELLRRDAHGNWPKRALVIEGGMLELESIEFRVPLTAIYRRTRLANGTPRRSSV